MALGVDGVNLSAVIESWRTAIPPWTVLASVEISINRCDGWLRRYAESAIQPLFGCAFERVRSSSANVVKNLLEAIRVTAFVVVL